MKRLLIALPAAVAVALALGGSQAAAWQKDPDTTVDPTHAVFQLLAPDVTIGDNDSTVAGTGTDAVGIDDSMTNPPADPADDHPGHIYFVDNTPLNGDCPSTPYTTIQAGVDASGPGDTVKVCPGTYPEQVRITGHGHDRLKLESLRPLQAVIQWPTAESAPLALVDFNTADHVTFRSFVATGPFTFPACSPERHEGLLVENAFDEHIHHNHITMIKNSLPANQGCQEGDAVAIGHRVGLCSGTAPGSADLDHNLIDDYQKNGVAVFNAGSEADIGHNDIIGPMGTVQPHAASNGVVILCQASAEVEHNSISKNHFTGSFMLATSGGVIVGQAADSTEVDHNRIFENDYGVETDSQIGGLEISHNDVFRNLTDGIVLCGDSTQFCDPAEQIVVIKNDVMDNGGSGGSGILLLGADSNLLKSNHVDENGISAGDTTDGFRVDVNSGDNQILDNHMRDNLTHDCHDDSVGAGTGGTANIWQGDRGETQNRPGLCR